MWWVFLLFHESTGLSNVIFVGNGAFLHKPPRIPEREQYDTLMTMHFYFRMFHLQWWVISRTWVNVSTLNQLWNISCHLMQPRKKLLHPLIARENSWYLFNTMLEAMRYDDVGFKERERGGLIKRCWSYRMILSQARENNCFSYHKNYAFVPNY